MNRVIFEEAKEIDQISKKVIELIFDMTDWTYNHATSKGITEERLSHICNITRRKVRKIVERYNYNKYLGIDSTKKIKVIKGRYRVVKDELVDQVYKYHKDNFHEYILKFRIMAKALGKVDINNLTMEELQSQLEELDY